MDIPIKRISRSNWSKTENYIALCQLEPTDVKEICEIVEEANLVGKKIYCRGREHHWGLCGETNEDTIVIFPNIHFISEIEESEDKTSALVEIGASVRLEELNLHLAKTKWALENMGAIAEQNVSALVSTNTHGTHPQKGGFSTLVHELCYVNSKGELRKCIRGTESWEEAKYILGSTGKAGIVTSLKLKLVPSFNLKVQEVMLPNEEALSQLEIESCVNWAIENNGYVRWFLFPNSGTGEEITDEERCPLDTVNTGFTQVTKWEPTTKSGKGRGWFRTLVEGFVANYITKKIDRLLDKDFRDRDPDWLHKVTRTMIWLMKSPYQFVGRSDLALTAEPNMPIKSQVGSHTSELYFRVECAEKVIKAVLSKIDQMSSVGKCFIWKPMRVRVMSGDRDAYCSQVYETDSESSHTYMTMDIDIYEGQYLGRIETIYAQIRNEADIAIQEYNRVNSTSYPLTTFHLGKVAPLLDEEFNELFRSRPGIKKFIEYMRAEESMPFMHTYFIRMFGINKN